MTEISTRVQFEIRLAAHRVVGSWSMVSGLWFLLSVFWSVVYSLQFPVSDSCVVDGLWCVGAGVEGSPGSPDRRAPASGRPSPAQFGVWGLRFGAWGLRFGA